MKKILVVLSVLVLFIVCASAAEAYAWISVTGSKVNVRSAPNTGGKVLTRANPGDAFVAEDMPVTNPADGSRWYKIVILDRNGFVPLAEDRRFGGAEAVYISADFVRATKMAQEDEENAARVLEIAANKGAEIKLINVSNTREFLEALGSNRIIEMSPGVYNLSEYDAYLNYAFKRDGQAPRYPNLDEEGEVKLSKGVAWSDEPFDGGELVLTGIKNLTIHGMDSDGEGVNIVVDPRYAFVLKFVKCSNITIEGVTAGHSEGGYCAGGVFGFADSSKITIDSSDLYGCGTEGLLLEKVSDMRVDLTAIRECTYDIMTITDGRNISFSACNFHDNKEFTMITINGKSSNVTFDQTAFVRNEGTMFHVEDSAHGVVVSEGTFIGNTDGNIENSSNVTFRDCKF